MDETVTISRVEYDRLRSAAEDLDDLKAYDRGTAAVAAREEELVPAQYADRLMNGENPVRVWREFRGSTQAALAARADIDRVMVSEIETGRKAGSIATMKRLADALGVTVDDLLT